MEGKEESQLLRHEGRGVEGGAVQIPRPHLEAHQMNK